TELIADLPYEELRGGDAEVEALCTDSRVSGEGDLFFCFHGTKTDSHRYAAEAARRGVSAIVCERDCGVSCPQVIVKDGREAMAFLSAAFYGHPERSLKIFGVTGTNGKTTTSYLLRSILEESGLKTGVVGTLGAKYGTKTVPPALTTPDPAFLFSLLADMRDDGMSAVVMEVSAHALALGKVRPIVFEGAIFTNLTQDHLDFFGTMEEYGRAKKRLFTSEACRFAVVNSDDAFSRELVGEVPVVSYGLENPADAFAVVEAESARGSRVLLNLSDELCETFVPMPGRYNVSNALAAAACARRFGVTAESIGRGIAKTERVDGRLEWVANFRGADIFVDFAHTPDGLEKSLLALRKHCKGKLVCLFGCGGNRDEGKRPKMGETAAKYADFAVITSDNPRYEDPCAIISKIEEGYRRYSKRYVTVEEREKGTEYAVNLLSEGDILLVAGKGGETCQEIMGIKYLYNDKAVIETVIGKLKE
ncbi:MAG: UDP-N-acetylmuramoyl-L-alanyl-D-glutamate--2,6-diaminopimelate ligase, partial [Candidatus Gallimonas sp.]